MYHSRDLYNIRSTAVHSTVAGSRQTHASVLLKQYSEIPSDAFGAVCMLVAIRCWQQ